MEQQKQQIAAVMAAAVKYDQGDARRIQHLIKVHDLCRMIGVMEKLGEEELFILETAAILHDIGIHLCEEKYGRCDGKLQEQEGPAVAQQILKALSYEEKVIERVSYLIAHHHTYTDIEGMDYQILVEADFLVNLYEDALPKAAVMTAYHKIFVTASGKALCRDMYGLKIE